jgi:hypothetical protein
LKNVLPDYRSGHNLLPLPNSNDLNACENFLKNRKFQRKIIVTGQTSGWSFAKKETPPKKNTEMGHTSAKKVI